MIPIIHVLCQYVADIENNCATNELKTVFFIVKESVESEYYCVIGEHNFGKSRETFSLQLNKNGIYAYINTFSQYIIHNTLITMEEQQLCSCPVWNYKELRRRVAASSLHRLDNRNDIHSPSIESYLEIVDNSFYESVAYPECEEFDPLDYWREEDY